MRKPWKRPSTPKKDILKRGDGAKRRRAALQRSIEKAADELGHQAPGAWHRPAAEASYGVRQFMQQQRALRKGESPVPPEAPAPRIQNQIPWQDVKTAAEQRFQALLGVQPQQHAVPSGVSSPRPYEFHTNSSCDDGLMDMDNSCSPSYSLHSHTGGLPSTSYQVFDLCHPVRQPPAQSQSATTSKRSQDGGSDIVRFEGCPPQRLPASSWGAVVGTRNTVAADSGGTTEAPTAASPLGLTFSDLVRQSINRAQIVTDGGTSREGQSMQETSGAVVAADHPVKQLHSAAPPSAEHYSPEHGCISTAETSSHSSKDQATQAHARTAPSLPDEEPASRLARPLSGARPASGPRPTRSAEPAMQTQQTQRSCSASSFSGILEDSSMIHATCGTHGAAAGQLPEAAAPPQPDELPEIAPSRQHRHTQHAACTTLRGSSDVTALQAQSSSAVQKTSPAARMEQLLQNMQQLQILRHKARKELEATSSKRNTTEVPAAPQPGMLSHTPRQSSAHEESVSHTSRNSIPGVVNSHSQPPERLPELNRRCQGRNCQGREADTEGNLKVQSRDESG